MKNRIGGVRRVLFGNTDELSEGMRALYGDRVADSRAARAGLAGIRLASFLTVLRPALSLLIVVCFAFVQPAFGQNIQINNGDSGLVGRVVIAVLKTICLFILVASVGSCLLAIWDGIRGEAWQKKAGWGFVGLLASGGGLVAWLMSLSQGTDTQVDLHAIGR
jgi:hypothetical protein